VSEMNTAYVLIMLWTGTYVDSGVAVVQQEFTSFQACEEARRFLATANKTSNVSVVVKLHAQGCFKK